MAYDIYDMIYYLQLGWHPAAVGHYKFTHKQYTEYRERNIHNHKKFYRLIWEVRAVPRLGELNPGICLTTQEKGWKNLS
jgi:hypothetical protein